MTKKTKRTGKLKSFAYGVTIALGIFVVSVIIVGFLS